MIHDFASITWNHAVINNRSLTINGLTLNLKTGKYTRLKCPTKFLFDHDDSKDDHTRELISSTSLQR